MRRPWWLIILLAAISGASYRLGGWIQTKIRDFGCALITLLSYLIFGLWCKNQLVNIIAYLLCFGALFGALTTYWKKKGEPARWWNWALTGLFYGLAAFPLIMVGVHWWAILLRAVVLSILITVESVLIDDVNWEEGLRGALIVATVPLLTL